MDKLDAAAIGRGEWTCGRPAPFRWTDRRSLDCQTRRTLLEPDAAKVASPVLRRARRREAPGLSEYARHDQRLGGESPLWRLMAPTTSQRQLLLREEGGKEARGETATQRTETVCEAGRSGRAGSAWRSPMSIKGPSRRRGGCAGKAVGLIRGDLHGSPRCPSAPEDGAFVGWCGTVRVGRRWLAVEKSAEAVLPAGIVMVAGKGRTRSRASGRSCS
jgi:hypothetical protein